MKINAGDEIRADLGRNNLYVRGTVERVEGASIFVKTPAGNIMECPLKGDHTVNGKKTPDPEGPYKRLKALDRVRHLSEWEREFVGDLMQSGRKHFSPKQEEMIDRIYKRRVIESA